MIRILHIVTALSLSDGTTAIALKYYRHLDRRRVQCDFLYFTECDSRLREEVHALGGEVFHMDMPRPGLAFWREREAFFQKRQGRYIAIHCHALFAVTLFSGVAKKYGIPHIIAHSHSTSLGNGLVRKCRNSLLVWPIRFLATRRFACSLAAARFMFGASLTAAGKVDILRNAVDCAALRFDPVARARLRAEWQLTEDTLLLGHVGRFSPEKNHAFLLEVFRELRRRRSNVALLLVGDGPLRPALQQQVEEEGLERQVFFTGNRPDVPCLLSAMDVFLFPSRYEGFGAALVEAQAAGLPCVASDVIPEEARLLHTEFLPVGDAAHWADRVCALGKVADRAAAEAVVRQAGFDIREEGDCLSKYYLEL